MNKEIRVWVNGQHVEVSDYVSYERDDLMSQGFSFLAAQKRAENNIRQFMLQETRVWLDFIAGRCPLPYDEDIFVGPEQDNDGEVDVADEELDEPEDL